MAGIKRFRNFPRPFFLCVRSAAPYPEYGVLERARSVRLHTRARSLFDQRSHQLSCADVAVPKFQSEFCSRANAALSRSR